MKTYTYSDYLGRIRDKYDIPKAEAKEILELNGIIAGYKSNPMNTPTFKKSVNSILVAHFRHESTRYEKAITGGKAYGKKGKKIYKRLKTKYSEEASSILNQYKKVPILSNQNEVS